MSTRKRNRASSGTPKKDKVQSFDDPIEEECKAVRNGTHKKFIAQVKVLEEEQREQLRTLKKWKKEKMLDIEHQYEYKKKESMGNFIEARELHRTQLLEEISSSRRKERAKSLASAMTTRRRTAATNVKTPLTMDGVRSTYRLKPEEIEEDMKKLANIDKKTTSMYAYPHLPKHLDLFEPIYESNSSSYQSTHYNCTRLDKGAPDREELS